MASASARLCLDKSIMRERFQERIGTDAAARFHVVNSETDLLKFANELGWPVFLQPSNVSASMWSTRNTSPEMLLANYRAMVDEVLTSLKGPESVMNLYKDAGAGLSFVQAFQQEFGISWADACPILGKVISGEIQQGLTR